MPLHHVKSNYNLILYYTSTYVERMGVSQYDNACSFMLYSEHPNTDNYMFSVNLIHLLTVWVMTGLMEPLDFVCHT